MLHGSETWPVRKENKVGLQRAEIRMVRWMCGIKQQDRVPSKGLRVKLGLDDIILVLWCACVRVCVCDKPVIVGARAN